MRFGGEDRAEQQEVAVISRALDGVPIEQRVIDAR